MTAPGGFSPNDVLTAADMNALPGGVVAANRNNSPPTLSTSEQTIVSSTFTAQSGRTYLAIANLAAVIADAAGYLELRIYDPSTRIGTQLSSWSSTSYDYAGGTVFGYFSPSAGSTTVEFRALLAGGATSMTIVTSFLTEPQLLVFDMGPT